MDTTLILARLRKFEDSIPHMYVCTGGEVTIGIGHAIHGADEAVALSWMLDGQPAPEAQVRADFARVAAAPKGLAAKGYASLSRCRMSDAAINALVAADIARFSRDLAAGVPNWDQYPGCVQAALFDMGFNLGVAGLQKFHKLLAACDARDWKTAAIESHRIGIGEERNQETAALFLQAQAAASGAS